MNEPMEKDASMCVCKTLKEIRFKKYETAGLFGGERKLTATEMNSFTSDLQAELIEIKHAINSLMDEIKTMRCGMDLLDEQHMEGIEGAIKLAEIANQRAEDAQQDRDKTIELLEKSLKTVLENNEKQDRRNKKLTNKLMILYIIVGVSVLVSVLHLAGVV